MLNRLFFVLIIFSTSYSFGQLNIEEVSRINYQQLRGQFLNDIWGYVDETGVEYALVGARDGVSIVSLANPSSPHEVFWLQGDFSVWRDLKTFGDYLYVTTEAESGLLIIDLSPLPLNPIVNYTYYQGPSGNEWQSAHNLYIDEDGFAYIFGANRDNGGVIILDVAANPMNPIEVGTFENWYVHDGFVRNDIMYLAHIYDGFISLIDVSDKTSPILLGTVNTPSNFAHNIWPSDDGQYVFTTDEVSGGFLAAYDVTDPSNIFEVDQIQSSPGMGIVPHNAHVYQDWLVTSYYTDGITIHDISRPQNMIEVGNYDTSPLQNTNTQGCWGAYPFLPSGLILATDIEEGLFVLQPAYKRGSYLEGNVKNAANSNNLQGVQVQISGNNQNDETDLTGNYATGIAGEGNYEVTFSKVTFFPKTESIILTEGAITQLDVELEPMPPFDITVNVVDADNGMPIVDANVLFRAELLDQEFTSNGLGQVNAQLFYEEEYEVIVGKWEYRTTCSTMDIDESTGTLTIELTRGYYDDFTFDFGWTTTSNAEAGLWVRDVPNPTETFSNPEADVPYDCGDKAFVTGNEGINPNTDNVTNGTVVLISPVFNLQGMSDPHINYWTYFYNEFGPFDVDDTLSIVLSNGLVTARIDFEAMPESTMRQWLPKSIRVLDFMVPTANMQLFVSISDFNETVNITEAAFDYFSITNSNVLSIDEKKNGMELEFAVYPNPFTNEFTIGGDIEQISSIRLLDVSGVELIYQSNPLIDTSKLAKGVYFLQITTLDNQLVTKTVVKN